MLASEPLLLSAQVIGTVARVLGEKCLRTFSRPFHVPTSLFWLGHGPGLASTIEQSKCNSLDAGFGHAPFAPDAPCSTIPSGVACCVDCRNGELFAASSQTAWPTGSAVRQAPLTESEQIQLLEVADMLLNAKDEVIKSKDEAIKRADEAMKSKDEAIKSKDDKPTLSPKP